MYSKASWNRASCGVMTGYTKECRAHCNLHFASDTARNQRACDQRDMSCAMMVSKQVNLSCCLNCITEVMGLGNHYKLVMWSVVKIGFMTPVKSLAEHAQRHELFLPTQPQWLSWDGQEAEMKHDWDSCVRVAKGILYAMWGYNQS